MIRTLAKIVLRSTRSVVFADGWQESAVCSGPACPGDITFLTVSSLHSQVVANWIKLVWHRRNSYRAQFSITPFGARPGQSTDCFCSNSNTASFRWSDIAWRSWILANPWCVQAQNDTHRYESNQQLRFAIAGNRKYEVSAFIYVGSSCVRSASWYWHSLMFVMDSPTDISPPFHSWQFRAKTIVNPTISHSSTTCLQVSTA